MAEPKTEGVEMVFTPTELEKRAEEQGNDLVNREETDRFRLEREAISISGEETLKQELEQYQLARAFDETEKAEESLNNMRTMLKESGEKLASGEWAEMEKEIFREIMKGEEFRLSESKDNVRFRVALNGLKEKFGPPIILKDNMDASELFGLGGGEFTRIANTPYVAYVFDYHDSRILIVKKWEDDHLEKLENLKKNRAEVN